MRKEDKEMKIIRVFPIRTKSTPDDPYAFIGYPSEDESLPYHDEVHISCTFTWDKPLCRQLKCWWEGFTSKPVKLGGVAFGSPSDNFIPGMYVKEGITFTTRGCNNKCPWCIVPKNEGVLQELPIVPGNIIQDNNFLQASPEHKDRVFEMLKTQRRIEFKGGLECKLIDDDFLYRCQDLGLRKIKSLWIACDTHGAIPLMEKTVKRLHETGFNQNKIYCYTLIGDDMEENEERCRAIYDAGAMPHAQLFREFSEEKIKYSTDWNKFERMWKRPPATKSHMKKGTNYWDF